MSSDSTIISVTALGVTGFVSLLSPYLAGRVQRSVQREALLHQQKQGQVVEQRRVLSRAMQTIAEAATYLTSSLGDTDADGYKQHVYALTGSSMQVRLWFGRESPIAKDYSTCANAAMTTFEIRRAKADSDRNARTSQSDFAAALQRLLDTATPLLETLESPSGIGPA